MTFYYTLVSHIPYQTGRGEREGAGEGRGHFHPPFMGSIACLIGNGHLTNYGPFVPEFFVGKGRVDKNV